MDATVEIKQKSLFDYLMDGITAMIPFIVAGGMLMALGFAVAGASAMNYPEEGIGTLGQVLYFVGNKMTMSLMFVVCAGFIADSIGGRAALLGGFVGGMIANYNGSSFLGAVLAGFLAGVLVRQLSRINIPERIRGVWDILVIPVVSTLIIGLVSVYVIGIPVSWFMNTAIGLLNRLNGASLIVLCIVLSVMMVVDLCGPCLRVAYVFSIATVTASPTVPSVCMAAVIAAGMTAPLGMAIATMLSGKRFTAEEREQGRACWVLGICFIVEGVIPFEMRDPRRVIPACCAGAGVTGALSVLFHTGTTLVHGGAFLLLIPGAMRNPLGYAVAIIIGSVITAVFTIMLKKDIEEESPDESAVHC